MTLLQPCMNYLDVNAKDIGNIPFHYLDTNSLLRIHTFLLISSGHNKIMLIHDQRVNLIMQCKLCLKSYKKFSSQMYQVTCNLNTHTYNFSEFYVICEMIFHAYSTKNGLRRQLFQKEFNCLHINKQEHSVNCENLLSKCGGRPSETTVSILIKSTRVSVKKSHVI